MEEDKRTFGLRTKINKAAAIRQMCETPGFQILQEEFKGKVEKITSQILDADTSLEEVAVLRQKVQTWTEISKMLKTLMLTGELCKRALEGNDLFTNTSPEEMDKEK